MRIEPIISRCEAEPFVTSHKRCSDIALYRILRDCLQISEICISDETELSILNTRLRTLPLLPGKTRQYIEHSSDVYQRVCRLVFHGEGHSANINRYAICIREAAAHQITHENLIETLNASGGISNFYLRRPGLQQIIRTKCIRLDQQIIHHKHETITLKLLRLPNNVYKVLECKSSVPTKPISQPSTTSPDPKENNNDMRTLR